jgi:putative Holliday junction resolvase
VRLLGIDFGAARTGLALSDPLGMTCSPLEVVHERDQDRLLERIRKVVDENQVTEMVVGHPRPLAGGTNPQQQAAEAFAELLSMRLRLPVHLWDERFTSKLAERPSWSRSNSASPGRGRPGQERERTRQSRRPLPRNSSAKDAVAACHVLQGYLDARSLQSREETP